MLLKYVETDAENVLQNHSPTRASTAVKTCEWLALLESARPNAEASSLAEALAPPLNWPRFLALADEHGLQPLLGARLRAADIDPPGEVHQQLLDAQRAQIVFTLSLTAELFRVLDRCASDGIEILLTKGPALAARCYGDPGSRQYTDLDFVARSADIGRATATMMALGYQSKVPVRSIEGGKFPGEYVFVRPETKLMAEFHTERTFRYHPRPLPIEQLFARRASVRLDGREIPVLSVEDELMLISIHAAKHFWTRLMWVADVAALISRQNVDWDRAISAAREVSAERMLRIALLLAVNVLGARVPAKIESFLRADSRAIRIATGVARRLPWGESITFGVLGRAMFRMKMRGGLLQGPVYLLRLSLSPTEEDWVVGAAEQRSWIVDAAARPFRLARKYGRGERTP
jgi:hypothetical protein